MPRTKQYTASWLGASLRACRAFRTSVMGLDYRSDLNTSGRRIAPIKGYPPDYLESLICKAKPMANNTTKTENASVLSIASKSGFDLSNMNDADWKAIGQIINGFAKNAKDDSLNCNPSVLFIKTAKVLKAQCNVARLPDNVAEQVKSLCNKVAENEMDMLKELGYIQHRISKATNRVDMRSLSVGTTKQVSFRRDNWSNESQCLMLKQEIRKLEKVIESRELEYKETDTQESKIAGYRKLLRILELEIADSKKPKTDETGS